MIKPRVDTQELWVVLRKTPRARIWHPQSCHGRRSDASRAFYENVKADPFHHHAIRRVEVRP